MILNRIIRETGWDEMDWIDLTQDNDQWRAHVNAVMALRIKYNFE